MSAYLLACWFEWLTEASLPLSVQSAEPGENVSRPFSGAPQNQRQSGCVLSHFPRLQIPRALMVCKYPQGLSLNCIYIIFILCTFPGQSYMSHCLHLCKLEPTAPSLFSDHKKIVITVCYLCYLLLLIHLYPRGVFHEHRVMPSSWTVFSVHHPLSIPPLLPGLTQTIPWSLQISFLHFVHTGKYLL